MKKHRWDCLEKLLFALITLLNLLPFLSVRFFPSLDGASHLMNANIINQILIWHNDLFQQFFRLNPEPVPNWTTHFILAALQLVFPAFVAEKILLTGILLGLPLAFRKMVGRLSPRNILYSYLIFPFSHSLFLFFGFYNFCIAVIFLILTLDQWLKYENQRLTVKSFMLLTFLIILTYFSHILVFGVLLLILGIRILARAAGESHIRSAGWGQLFREAGHKFLTLLEASLLPLSLFFYFFISRPATHQTSYLPTRELLSGLGDIRSLIAFDHGRESRFTILLLLLLFALLLFSFFRFLFRKSTTSASSKSNLWLPLVIVALVALYFILPNTYGTASFTSLRLSYLAFLFLILWIPTLPLPRWSGIPAVIIALYVNFSLLMLYQPVIRDYSKIAISCNKASEFIQPNSLILPLNCSENWFTSHFLDYVAIDKPILLVYNYESETGYFPVTWNDKRRPGFFIGNENKPSNFQLFRVRSDCFAYRVNYILILGTFTMKDDIFYAKLPKILAEEFTIAYRSEFCTLYKRKK
ncbi:MAG: hypothetical protein WCO93_02385 [bacterium]